MVCNDEFIRIVAQHSDIFAGGFVCVHCVLGSEVVHSAGKVEGRSDVSDDFLYPGDAAEFAGGELQWGTGFDGGLYVSDKVEVGMHAGSFDVVHPGGSQCDGVAADVQRPFFRYQLVPSVVVFR